MCETAVAGLQPPPRPQTRSLALPHHPFTDSNCGAACASSCSGPTSLFTPLPCPSTQSRQSGCRLKAPLPSCGASCGVCGRRGYWCWVLLALHRFMLPGFRRMGCRAGSQRWCPIPNLLPRRRSRSCSPCRSVLHVAEGPHAHVVRNVLVDHRQVERTVSGEGRRGQARTPGCFCLCPGPLLCCPQPGVPPRLRTRRDWERRCNSACLLPALSPARPGACGHAARGGPVRARRRFLVSGCPRGCSDVQASADGDPALTDPALHQTCSRLFPHS